LIKNVPHEAIIEVWNVCATGTQGVVHYLILLDEGTHLCTCLLLINKGLVCQHFFRVGTYSRYATFHISMIPSRWYLNPDIEPSNLLQKYSSIPVCNAELPEDDIVFEKSINFQHFFSLRDDSSGSYRPIKSPKCVYAELFGLSRKGIDCAIKAGMQQELSNMLKTFIYDAQNRINSQEVEIQDSVDVTNPVIVKHKGRPPKRLKSNIEQNGKRVLKDSVSVNNNSISNTLNTVGNDNVKGRKCGRCKQYGHYAKTCPNA